MLLTKFTAKEKGSWRECRFPESEPKWTAWINAYSQEGVDAVRVFASLHSSLLVGFEANKYVSRIVLSERLKQP